MAQQNAPSGMFAASNVRHIIAMQRKDIIVIGASAGGIDALRTVFAQLPANLDAAIFVVIHTAPNSPGILANIFDDAGPLVATSARDGERIERQHIYVAPPDHHLLIAPNRVQLTRGPKENRFRPAVDPLFRSAAQTYGPRVVGVILTGGLDDGTNGLWTVRQLGGTTIVQDPAEALAPSMPLSALRHVRVDHKVRIAELAALLIELAAQPADAPEGGLAMPDEVKIEVDIAREENATEAGVLTLGDPSLFACPECHGVLLQLKEATPLRFRCHTGHAYTVESLLSDMNDGVEDALWNAVRALEEKLMLLQQLASHEHVTDQDKQRMLHDAEEAQRRAEAVRQVALTAVESR